MHTSITNEQFVNFVLNDVNDDERENIIEAINTNPEIKERYLFEKRKHDVERYIYDEIDIGESCEIEELMKMDSRLYDHFVSNTEANDVEEQDESINVMHIAISKEQLENFALNRVDKEEHKKISKAININPLTKERYLYEKRKYDVEKYLDDKMDFGERCEFEELLKINSRLFEYFESKKGVVEEEQDVSINQKHIAITKEQLVNFILNDVNDEEREKISEAINTKSLTKEKYLFEKRKYDVDRYIAGKMDIGERCEIEELIKMNPGLYDHFELNNGVIEEEQDESLGIKQIDITNEQLFNFVLNDVNKEEHKKISEAINTNPLTKERYLFEKRKYDVDRYIDDELNFGERCEIEELLETNSRLRAHFELNKDVIEFIQTTLSECDRVENEVNFKDTAPVIELKFNVMSIGKWVAAASIIFMIGLSSGNVYLNNRASLENRLYAKYYEPLSEEKINYFNNSSINTAINKYFNKEYDVALILLENMPNTMTIEVEKQLYYGLTLMELKRFDEAIDAFGQIINNDYKSTKPFANWNLALCYLKTGEQEKAKIIFEKIVQRNDFQYKEAKRILNKLNQ